MQMAEQRVRERIAVTRSWDRALRKSLLTSCAFLVKQEAKHHQDVELEKGRDLREVDKWSSRPWDNGLIRRGSIHDFGKDLLEISGHKPKSVGE